MDRRGPRGLPPCQHRHRASPPPLHRPLRCGRDRDGFSLPQGEPPDYISACDGLRPKAAPTLGPCQVRAIVKALADQDPDLFARIKGGFPGNFDAVREYVEETDEGLRDSPLKRRRVEEPAQQGQEGVEESGEGAEKGQATEDGAQGEDGGVAKSTTE